MNDTLLQSISAPTAASDTLDLLAVVKLGVPVLIYLIIGLEEFLRVNSFGVWKRAIHWDQVHMPNLHKTFTKQEFIRMNRRYFWFTVAFVFFWPLAKAYLSLFSNQSTTERRLLDLDLESNSNMHQEARVRQTNPSSNSNYVRIDTNGESHNPDPTEAAATTGVGVGVGETVTTHSEGCLNRDNSRPCCPPSYEEAMAVPQQTNGGA